MPVYNPTISIASFDKMVVNGEVKHIEKRMGPDEFYLSNGDKSSGKVFHIDEISDMINQADEVKLL